MKITQKQFLVYWLPVMALCMALFVQSCFPSLDLGPSFPLKDKVLHMAVYGLLAALFYRACSATWPGRMSPITLLAISVSFASIYGVSDEFHQAFVAARQADVYDLLADILGSLLGSVGYMTVACQSRLSRLSKTGR